MMNTAAMISILIAVVAMAANASAAGNISTIDQLPNYKKKHPFPIGLLTTSSGFPVSYEHTQAINGRLIRNAFFMDVMANFDRERIPERAVHPKGAGGFGYFNVTHDLSDICKAQVFNTIGKITPVTVRFSLTTTERGGSDLTREPRGFSVKFYTDEGNYDFVGLNVEMFVVKDPVLFPSFIHAFSRNPKTFVFDENSQWDYLTLRPEALHTFMRVFGDRGIPNGFRFLPGFAIHTFELYNNHGDRNYVRFHLLPDAGIKFFTTAEASQITDPDYAIKDLYDAIANGNFPTWTLSIQVIKSNDVTKAKFDIFDVTKSWPLDDYPLRSIGQLVLNKNPDNYFAEIEQLAFNPGNLVPGILGVDTVLEARVFSYADTQFYRLGKNYNKIPINCPLYAKNYNRDGIPPVQDNGGDSPNYYPNSFNQLLLYLDTNRPSPAAVATDPRVNNFDQVRELYAQGMSAGEKCRLAVNIADSLRRAASFLQVRALELYKSIHIDLGKAIELNLESNQTNADCTNV